MNTRLEQQAADALAWHERQERHKRGYGPRPVQPIAGRIAFPVLTEQQKQEREQQINAGIIHF
ncbi:MAG: hypothetical protein V4633_13360 [Pseudomonadota bacterium]